MEVALGALEGVMTNTSKEQIEDALFDSVVLKITRDNGTITDLDTLVINRASAVNRLYALFTQQLNTAVVEALEAAKWDVDFAKRWSFDYDEILANMEERIATLKQQQKELE